MSAQAKSFVLFPLGGKRFALPAEIVNEMACPDRVQKFPHTTPLLTGVLVRRGRIVPVCDVAQVLIGSPTRTQHFCLIANLRLHGAAEWVAVPVTGDGELVNAELLPRTGQLPQYVTGLLALKDEIVEVIDLAHLVGTEGHA